MHTRRIPAEQGNRRRPAPPAVVAAGTVLALAAGAIVMTASQHGTPQAHPAVQMASQDAQLGATATEQVNIRTVPHGRTTVDLTAASVVGHLAAGSQVTVVCGFTGTTAGAAGNRWYQVSGPAVPPVDSGSDAVVSATYLTLNTGAATVPSCADSGNTAITDNSVTPGTDPGTAQPHDSGVPGPGGVRDGLATLVATQIGTGNPFTLSPNPADPSSPTCQVGTAVVECAGINPTNPAAEGFLPTIARYARETGVDPRLMLVILWVEDAHVHLFGLGDAAATWFDTVFDKSGPSIGLADMKVDTFNQVQDAHRELFGGYKWDDLKTDNDLAIKTLAYKLADIEHRRTPDQTDAEWHAASTDNDVLPATWTNTDFRRDEMAALAGNQGATTAVDFVDQDWKSLLAHAVEDGLAAGMPPLELLVNKKDHYLQVYVAEFQLNWAHADQLFCGTGTFTCTG